MMQRTSSSQLRDSYARSFIFPPVKWALSLANILRFCWRNRLRDISGYVR